VKTNFKVYTDEQLKSVKQLAGDQQIASQEYDKLQLQMKRRYQLLMARCVTLLEEIQSKENHR